MILQLHKESQKVGLEMHMKKTKVIFNNYILHYEIEIDYEVIDLSRNIFTSDRNLEMGWGVF